MRVLSSSEQQKLSKYLLEQLSPCNLGILICLYTGLRIGEICALKWRNVSFEEGCIYVQESMQRIQVQEEKRKTAIFILPPKSACSIRRIPLPAELIRILEAEQKDENAFVLTGEENRFVEPRCLENRFNAITAECKIDSVAVSNLIQHNGAEFLLLNDAPAQVHFCTPLITMPCAPLRSKVFGFVAACAYISFSL